MKVRFWGEAKSFTSPMNRNTSLERVVLGKGSGVSVVPALPDRREQFVQDEWFIRACRLCCRSLIGITD